MCTSSVSHKPLPYKLTSPAKAKENIEKFRNLTPDELEHCRRVVRKVVPRYLCDPDEALSHGLMIASEKYQGFGNLPAYVAKCAYFYALRTNRKRNTYFGKNDDAIQAETLEDRERYYSIIGTCDPEPIDPLDPLFTQRIDAYLAEMCKDHGRHKTTTFAKLARRILKELEQSINHDDGIGITEFDEALKVPEWKGQLPRVNKKAARQVMYRHLAEKYDAQPYQVAGAFTALKRSAIRVLNEQGPHSVDYKV